MPDHLGDDMRKVKVEEKKEEEIKCKCSNLSLSFASLTTKIQNAFTISYTMYSLLSLPNQKLIYVFILQLSMKATSNYWKHT